ncbi:MAG: hypothetical protein JW987_10115 [Anaerolineaceae bacterium]|nr:hypothetical protein [Anaerolineaceae bacterium]
MVIEEIHKGLLGYCAHDDMGLWIIPRRITNSDTIKEKPEIVRRKSLEIIKEMLENGWIEIGIMVSRNNEITFQPLPMSTNKAMEFIDSEWVKLGRMPDIGEICWFRATPVGKKLAEDMGLEG